METVYNFAATITIETKYFILCSIPIIFTNSHFPPIKNTSDVCNVLVFSPPSNFSYNFKKPISSREDLTNISKQNWKFLPHFTSYSRNYFYSQLYASKFLIFLWIISHFFMIIELLFDWAIIYLFLNLFTISLLWCSIFTSSTFFSSLFKKT